MPGTARRNARWSLNGFVRALIFGCRAEWWRRSGRGTASLARWGANITGSTFLGPELVPKRLGILKEAIPEVSRVAALWHPGAFGERTTQDMLKETEVVARTLGMQLQLVEARRTDEFDGAFTAMTNERADALVTFPSPMLYGERRRLVGLAAKHRLASMFNAREFVELGGLMAYGTSLADLWRRAATYVDKILRARNPAICGSSSRRNSSWCST